MNKKEFESYIESLGKVKKINEVEGYEIVKLKDNIKPCALGCGKDVKNQHVEKRLAFFPEKHWRIRCSVCQKYMKPDGDGFIGGSHQVQAEFIKFFNNKDK